MTIPPPQGQPPYQLLTGGDVTIWLLPLVWHIVVFGPVFVHCGAATATGATAIAAETPAAAKSVIK